MIRRIVAVPVSGPGTQWQAPNGAMIPEIDIDDRTGELYLGGQKVSFGGGHGRADVDREGGDGGVRHVGQPGRQLRAVELKE